MPPGHFHRTATKSSQLAGKCPAATSTPATERLAISGSSTHDQHQADRRTVRGYRHAPPSPPRSRRARPRPIPPPPPAAPAPGRHQPGRRRDRAAPLENTLNVPIAVSVVRPEALHDFQSAGGDTLLSLSGRVPSLYVETRRGRIFPRFYIRGLGNIDFYLGASQPVEIIQDDVVEEHVVLKSNPAFDIGQVEVLKGPQGSLFGRNTTAGIIKFDSAQPSETWQGQGSLSYGRFNSVNADAGVGGPLTSDGARQLPPVGPVPAPRQLDQQHLYRPVGRRHRRRPQRPRRLQRARRAPPGARQADRRLSIRVAGQYRDYAASRRSSIAARSGPAPTSVPANFDAPSSRMTRRRTTRRRTRRTAPR